MSKLARTHWADEHGPICGALGHSLIRGPKDLRQVSEQQLNGVTCKRCVVKLTQWGFAIQNFQKLLNEIPGRVVAVEDKRA